MGRAAKSQMRWSRHSRIARSLLCLQVPATISQKPSAWITSRPIKSLTSSSPATVCATTVGNNLLWQSNASPSTIGGTCGANTILGNMNVQNNSGPLSIGATGSGNAVSGNANVNGNSGGGTMTGNAVTGNCQLSGDKPGIVGMGNTTGKGNNQCNTTSAGA